MYAFLGEGNHRHRFRHAILNGSPLTDVPNEAHLFDTHRANMHFRSLLPQSEFTRTYHYLLVSPLNALRDRHTSVNNCRRVRANSQLQNVVLTAHLRQSVVR